MADYAFDAEFNFKAKGLPQIAKQVQEMTKEAFNSTSVRAFAARANKIGKDFNKNIANALDMGMKGTAKTLTTVFQQADKNVSKAMAEIQAAQKKLQNATGAQAQEQRKIIKEKEKLIQKELKGIDAVTKKAEKALEKRQKALQQTASESVNEMMDGAVDSITGAFNQIKSGDLRGFGKTAAGALEKAGEGLSSAGAAASAKGAAGTGGVATALSTIGPALTALSSAAATLAAAVGPLAAIAAAFAMADGAAKDLNKTILEGAGAADIFTETGAAGMLEFRSTLDAAREASIALAFEYRGNAKEIAGIMSAANEAGLTFQEMEKAVGGAESKMDAYAQVAETALIYSRQLGVSTKEIAETSAQWLHDFGGSLQTVQQGFDAIFAAAQTSGIGVKRFYSMVSQATSGLALYNTSIEETTALIVNMAEALGEENAAQFIQELQKGFSGESYQDRFKRIMITGQDTTARVIEAQAVDLGERFASGINSAAPEIQEGVRDAFGEAGIDFDKIARGDAQALEALGGMAEQAQRRLIAQVGQVSDADARQLQTLIGLTEGMSGSLTDQAKALDELGPGGSLAMMLGQAEGFFGKGVSELTGMELAAFEQFSGVSGEQLHQLQRLDERMRADYELAKEQGKEVGSFEDYLMEHATQIEDAVAVPMSAQEAMAKQQVRNTESISSILENTIAYLLEKIADVLQILVDVTSGNDPAATAMRDRFLDANEQQQETITSNMEIVGQEISDLRTRMESSTGDERGRIRAEIEAKEEEMALMESTLESVRDEESEIRSMDTSGLLTASWREITTLGGAETAVGAVIGGGEEGILQEMGIRHGEGAREGRFREEYGRTLSDMDLAMMSTEEKQRLQSGASIGEETRSATEGVYYAGPQEEYLEEQVQQGEITAETLRAMQKLDEKGLKQEGDLLKDVVDEQERTRRSRTTDMVKALLKADAESTARSIGITDADEASDFADKLLAGDREAQARLRRAYTRDDNITGYEQGQAAKFGVNLEPKDFIYHTGSNSVTPLSNKDTIVGAMEGGPFDQANKSGGPMTVNINVNGGNQREVYATVKKAVAAGKRDRVGRKAR